MITILLNLWEKDKPLASTDPSIQVLFGDHQHLYHYCTQAHCTVTLGNLTFILENELFSEALVYTKHRYISGICLGNGTLIHYLKACGSLGIKQLCEEDHNLIKEASEKDLSIH